MDLVRWLILCLSMWWGVAGAVIAPSAGYVWRATGGAVKTFSTPLGACQDAATRDTAVSGGVVAATYSATRYECRGTRNGTPNFLFAYADREAASVCPSNSTLIGGSCSCNAGFYESNGACAQNNCPTSGTEVLPSGTVREAGNGLSTVICLAGCSAKAFMAARDGGKNYVWGPVRATGSPCTPSTSTPGASETANTCPAGKCPGTINGQSICVACSETKQDTTSTKTESASSTASGASSPSSASTTSSGGSSSTTCANGQCTTTSTSTTTNPDGSTTQKTSTESRPQSDYCRDNPKAAACDGAQSSWGGTCAAFVCDGDAVQCAQAQAAWQLKCELQTDKEDPSLSVAQAARSAGTRPSDHPGNDENAIPFQLSQMLDSTPLFGSSGDCPVDESIAVFGHVVVLPFASLCPYLRMLGGLMLSASYLAAAFIVFRG